MSDSAGVSQDVPVMQRVTSRYFPREDRLALTGALHDGSCRLWLTARLFRRLLPMLVKWLADQGPQVPHADMMHRWAQEAATAALQPAPEVRFQGAGEGAARDWLVDAVTLRDQRDALVLIWQVEGAGSVAALPMQAEPLRQWLHILCQQCRDSGWTDLAWPAWLRELPSLQRGALQ